MVNWFSTTMQNNATGERIDFSTNGTVTTGSPNEKELS